MKQTKLYIGNKNYSSWSMRAWLCLKKVGIDFEEILITLRTNQTKENILKISPSGKIPCLIHNNLKIWDSLAIALYLEETFPEANLFPKNKEIRHFAQSICAEMHSGFVNLRNEFPMDMKLKTEKEPTFETQKEIKRILEIWKICFNKSKGNFLFGDFSAADAFFAPVVSRFISYGVEIEDLAEYVESVSMNSFYQEWQNSALQEKPTIKIKI